MITKLFEFDKATIEKIEKLKKEIILKSGIPKEFFKNPDEKIKLKELK